MDLQSGILEVGPARLVVLHGWTMDHRGVVDIFEPAFDDDPGWRRI